MAPTTRHVRWLTAVTALALANGALVGAGIFARHAPPVNNPRLTLRSEGILLAGENRWGLFAVRAFASWDETLAYLENHHLKLPAISFAERSVSRDVLVADHPHAVKILWTTQGVPNVMFAPDVASARTFADYLKYSNLSPSLVGHSLRLEN